MTQIFKRSPVIARPGDDSGHPDDYTARPGDDSGHP